MHPGWIVQIMRDGGKWDDYGSGEPFHDKSEAIHCAKAAAKTSVSPTRVIEKISNRVVWQ